LPLGPLLLIVNMTTQEEETIKVKEEEKEREKPSEK
jgi:hypothetical protein